jgi:Transcriptional regulation of mitochondrial recombination
MLPDLFIRHHMMDLISHRLTPSNSPRFLLCRRHRTSPRFTPQAIPPSQSRPYTKSTLDRRRAGAVKKGLSVRLKDKAILLPPERPPPPSPHKPPLPPKAEAFGKPRDNSSKAAKAERFKEGRRIEKALRHEHHGENVYAYMHLGTKQVVYSLTRVMEVCFLCQSQFRASFLGLHGPKPVYRVSMLT